MSLSRVDDEIMELLWQNGQVVLQSQNQRSLKKSTTSKFHTVEDAVIPAERSTATEIRTSQEEAPNNLFIQEDEMASWLHYPLEESFDRDFCADLLYPSESAPAATVSASTHQIPDVRTATPTAPRPPIPPARRSEVLPPSRLPSFAHFSRMKARVDESGPSGSNKVRDSAIVDSSETPKLTLEPNAPQGQVSACAAAAVPWSGVGRDLLNCERSVTSSPGVSGASASAEPTKAPEGETKRKGREADETECQSDSEDAEFESAEVKKQVCGPTPAKRSRAAEVHNLSERRRRDRINEKMKALQELIPRCSKSDKASMLDEAIEYLKSLQLQVQMMSMSCSMVPMMFPGVQQYMPPMGIAMGLGMGMEMGLSRPMMPFPPVLANSTVPTQAAAAAAAARLGPRFPIPAFRMPALDPSRVQPLHQPNPMLNSQNPSQQRVPGLADAYQHYLGLHQMQMTPVTQVPAVAQPCTSRPSTSRGAENLENHQSG